MSQMPCSNENPSNDQRKYDLLSVVWGMREDRRLRRGDALKKKSQNRAEAKENKALAKPSLSASGKPFSNARRAARAMANVVAKPLHKHFGHVKPSLALGLAALCLSLWMAFTVFATLASCSINSASRWVSLPAEDGKLIIGIDRNTMLATGFFENQHALMKLSSFFEQKRINAPECLASGRCQEVDLTWKDWLRWHAQGTPPKQLAALGWKAQSWIEFELQDSPGSFLFSLVAFVGLFMVAAKYLAAQNAARKRGPWEPLANTLQSALLAAQLSLAVFVLFGGVWLLASSVLSLNSKMLAGSGMPSNRITWAALNEGAMAPEQAIWRLAGDPRTDPEWNASNEDAAQLKKCVSTGFCVTEDIENGQKSSALVNENRKIAKKLAHQQETRETDAVNRVFWLSLPCVVIFLWAASFPWDLSEKNKGWVERVERWARKGRPKMEQEEMLAQVRAAKKARKGRGQASPPAKRPPRAL